MIKRKIIRILFFTLVLAGFAYAQQQYAFGPVTVSGVPIVNGSPASIIGGTAIFPPRPDEDYFVDVSNSAVQDNSLIIPAISQSGVGCNSQPEALFGAPVVVSKTAGVGFRLSVGGLPIDSPLCIDYIILTPVN